MKKLLVTLLAVIMAFAMCACGETAEEEPSAGLANPVTECTAEEMLEATGFNLAAPENATDVRYFYISAEGLEPIAQVQFTVNDNEYCYRAQATAETEIMKSIDTATEAGNTLSGLNYEWKAGAMVDVSYCEGVCAFNEGSAGFVSWLDVVPGVLYSLGMNDHCTQDTLLDMAESIFVPLQGDVG